MRAKPMVLFAIALACGLVASISVSQYLEATRKDPAVQVEMEKIYVALTDVAIGEKLDAQNVKLEEWPKDKVPEGAISSLDNLSDKFTRTRLYAGEPVLQVKLMDRNDGQSQSIKIPEGFRVVSVKVDVEAGVSGLLHPGDRVDLVLVMKKNNETPETTAKTILKDVNVFAVDSETERSVDQEGHSMMAKTVSLLVKPPQVETVMLAGELGKLQLSLRRPNDTQEDQASGATVSQLLGSRGQKPQDRNLKSDDSFAQWLQGATAVTPPVPQPPPPPAVEESVPEAPPVPQTVWTMDVITPLGRQTFEWSDRQKFPQELPQNVTPAPAGASPAPAEQERSTLRFREDSPVAAETETAAASRSRRPERLERAPPDAEETR